MKILFIVPRFHINLYHQLKALKEAGHELQVLVLYKGAVESYNMIEPRVIGYSPVFLLINKLLEKFKKNYLKNSFELIFGFPSFSRLRREVKDFNPDLIVVKAYLDLLNIFSCLAAKIYHKKVVLLVQTSKNHIKGSKLLLKWYLRFLKLLGVVHIVTPIQVSVEALNSIGYYDISYIPFSCTIEDFTKEYFYNDKINLVSVGKFVKRKDPLLLLAAVNRLKNKHALRLILVGEKADDEYVKKVFNFIEVNDLQNIVEVKFNVPYEELFAIYRKSDLAVFPSYNEPAMVAVAEAMANKLPVICSNECGTRCYLEEGANGYVFRARDVEDLASKMELIIKDRRNIPIMGEKSFSLAKNNHSLLKFNEDFSKVVKLI